MSTQPTPPPGYEIIHDEDLRTKPLPVGYIVSDRDPNDPLWLDGKRAGKMVTEKSIASLTYARPLPANQKPEWQPIATAPKERGAKFRIAKQHSETGRLIDFGIWENHEPAFVDPSMTHWAPAPLPSTSTKESK